MQNGNKIPEQMSKLREFIVFSCLPYIIIIIIYLYDTIESLTWTRKLSNTA